MVRPGNFQLRAMKQIRKETRERRQYQSCKQRSGRLSLERKEVKCIIKGLKRGLLHCKYLSGQLKKEMRVVHSELLCRGSTIKSIQNSNLIENSGICLPLVDYEFDLLDAALSKTVEDWIGSHRYFLYMLVSTHFRMVVQKLCPLSHNPRRGSLHVGDCVSSLALGASTSRKHHMRRSLHMYATGQISPEFAKWVTSTVHIFRILAGPIEIQTLHPSYPLANRTWLLVPHIPWAQLFEMFEISTNGSFLTKRRNLKRVIIKISSFCVSCRGDMWRF